MGCVHQKCDDSAALQMCSYMIPNPSYPAVNYSETIQKEITLYVLYVSGLHMFTIFMYFFLPPCVVNVVVKICVKIESVCVQASLCV